MTDLILTDKPIATSHSSMGTFETCGRQYESKYLLKDVTFESGPEADWGNEVHTALEHYVRDGTPLPTNMAQYERFGRAVKNRPGEKLCEGAFAVTGQLTPTDFFAGDVWWRAKIDVINFVSDTHAEILDWKTGKMKPDTLQLMLYACLVFFHYPNLQTINAGYVWLKDGVVTPPIHYQRRDLKVMWGTFAGKYAKLAAALDLGVFQPRPSGLCRRHCPVRRCEFHGGR